MAVGQTGSRPFYADRVVVLKKNRTLELMSGGKVIKSYTVALGGEPVGPKRRQGDHKTPEGVYVLDSRNAHSQFHKSIHISYPNARDRREAQAHGKRMECLRAATSLCMDSRTDTGGSAPHIA
jgi:murein L,D-transpeptidase YafK